MANLFWSPVKSQLQEEVGRRKKDPGIDAPTYLLPYWTQTDCGTNLPLKHRAALVTDSQVPKTRPLKQDFLSVPRQKLRVSPGSLPSHKAGKTPDRCIDLGKSM